MEFCFLWGMDVELSSEHISDDILVDLPMLFVMLLVDFDQVLLVWRFFIATFNFV